METFAKIFPINHINGGEFFEGESSFSLFLPGFLSASRILTEIDDIAERIGESVRMPRILTRNWIITTLGLA